jgi:transposase
MGHPREGREFVRTDNAGGDDVRRDYPCALTDAMWQVVAVHLPVRDPRRGGRPLTYGHRLVIDTILYVLVSGCAWRLVPHDLAPWDAAYRRFRQWSAAGVWDDIHDALRDQARRAEGRDPAPSAAVLDAHAACHWRRSLARMLNPADLRSLPVGAFGVTTRGRSAAEGPSLPGRQRGRDLTAVPLRIT